MPKFIDNQKREWVVDINVAAVKRVRSLAGVDLLDILSGKLIDRLIGDPITLVDVLWAVVKPEADKLGISDEEFGRSMAGNAIDKATQALLEAIVAFTPSPKDRANIRVVLEATNRAINSARDRITERLAGIDQIAEHAVAEALKVEALKPGN